MNPDIQSALDRLRGLVGQEIGFSEWETYDQNAVSAFGAMTGEDLWVHTDPVRAAASRFGATIVQASLLMSRFGRWIQQVGAWLPDPAIPLNYGYDKVRILGSLPVDKPIRGRIVLRHLAESSGTVRMMLLVEAVRPNADRPIISAEWIVMFMLPVENQ